MNHACYCQGPGHDSTCWVINPPFNPIPVIGRTLDDIYNLVFEVRNLLLEVKRKLDDD